MHQTIDVLELAGSFRSGSINQALLATARELAPECLRLHATDLRTVPMYDGDLEAAGMPPEVANLRRAVSAADALLFVTPEYNGSLPPVLKNAIDWASRGYPESPLKGKLAVVVGASPGRSGTRSAQTHLRDILRRVGVISVDAPPVQIERSAGKIAGGRFVDAEVRDVVGSAMHALVEAVELSQSCGSMSAVVEADL